MLISFPNLLFSNFTLFSYPIFSISNSNSYPYLYNLPAISYPFLFNLIFILLSFTENFLSSTYILYLISRVRSYLWSMLYSHSPFSYSLFNVCPLCSILYHLFPSHYHHNIPYPYYVILPLLFPSLILYSLYHLYHPLTSSKIYLVTAIHNLLPSLMYSLLQFFNHFSYSNITNMIFRI